MPNTELGRKALQEKRTEELALDLLVLDSVRLPLKRRGLDRRFEAVDDGTPLVKRPAIDGNERAPHTTPSVVAGWLTTDQRESRPRVSAGDSPKRRR